MGKIIKIPIKNMTRSEWLEERNKGIGGSDIGSIFGIDKYKPSIKLFHQKIGWWNTDEEDNLAAYSGRVSEEHIYNNYWKYWNPSNPTADEMLINANNLNVMRKAKRVNYMLVNEDYDWLRGNIDYEINKDKNKGKGILELKMPNSSHWKSYKSGIPTPYIFQVQCYLAICEYDYAEVFSLMDGRYPEMFVFERHQSLIDSILERSYDFWKKVLKGREIVNDSSLSIDKKQLHIAQLEPEPENTDAFEEYIKERYRQGFFDNSIKSNEEIEKQRKEYWENHEVSKQYEDKKKLCKNIILSYMNTNSANNIICEDGKKIILTDKLIIPKI